MISAAKARPSNPAVLMLFVETGSHPRMVALFCKAADRMAHNALRSLRLVLGRCSGNLGSPWPDILSLVLAGHARLASTPPTALVEAFQAPLLQSLQFCSCAEAGLAFLRHIRETYSNRKTGERKERLPSLSSSRAGCSQAPSEQDDASMRRHWWCYVACSKTALLCHYTGPA